MPGIVGTLGRLPPPSSPDRNWLAVDSGLWMKSCAGRQVIGPGLAVLAGTRHTLGTHTGRALGAVLSRACCAVQLWQEGRKTKGSPAGRLRAMPAQWRARSAAGAPAAQGRYWYAGCAIQRGEGCRGDLEDATYLLGCLHGVPISRTSAACQPRSGAACPLSCCLSSEMS